MSHDDLTDLRRRLRAVEQEAIRAEIRDFRQEATASMNALRADFVDLRQDFSDLGEDVGRGFVEMRGKLDATAAGQQRVVELIESLIDQQNG